ncbi:putative S-layer protein [Xenococcus sp. PCC 7305]|uniref:S-layer homology domain-containing protein n=1 Tax=Xenococcus sp. PCC 7305 TaxID=102125 RepID=UPI0002AC0A3F|nr:S-layer homology domain-containing protein [Xenococcus sp. PCC 7305]ELS02282.1 putative S-layer protein [Xenococcus sp. PCC 7305]
MKLFSSVKIAAITATALGFSAVPGLAQTTFSDIEDNVYETEIGKASEMGIVKGFPDGTFRPDDTVSREQAAAMIVQAINGIVSIDLDSRPPQRSNVNPFNDVSDDRWSAKAINWMQWNLYPANVAQLTGNFRPEDPITRIELIDFLRRTGELVSIKLTGSAELDETVEPIKFTDVVGYDQVLASQMSAFCRVASPLNEEGDAFAPNEKATRDYAVAAIVRAVTCESKEQPTT